MSFPRDASLPSNPGHLNARWSGLGSRVDHNSFSELAARSGTVSNNNTVNMFIDSISEDYEYAASIVTACADQTVMALRCTDGPASVTVNGVEEDSGCGYNAVPITVAVSPSEYDVAIVYAGESAGHTAAWTEVEKCALSGTKGAICTVFGIDGKSTSTIKTSTLTGTDYYRFDVAVTGGAEKTVNPAATCPPNGASGISTKALAMRALTGVVGVVGFLAAL